MVDFKGTSFVFNIIMSSILTRVASLFNVASMCNPVQPDHAGQPLAFRRADNLITEVGRVPGNHRLQYGTSVS